MNKYFYKLMTAGSIVKGKDEEGNDIIWKVPFYSDMKKAYAKNEDQARDEMYSKLKNKWTGFRVFPNAK